MMMGPITVSGYCTKEYFSRVAKQSFSFVKHTQKFDFCAAARGDKQSSAMQLLKQYGDDAQQQLSVYHKCLLGTE